MLEHSSHCLSGFASLVLPLLVSLHNHFFLQAPILQLGLHVLLSRLRGFQVVTRALRTIQSFSLLPDALPTSCIPYHPWRPLGCQQQNLRLSFLSAGVSVSQGVGRGEEPLVSPDIVPGCCFLVLLPCLEWEESQW